MKGYTFMKKIWLKLAMVFTLAFMLCIPMTSMPTTADTGHVCACFGEMSTSQGIGQAEVDMLLANRDHPENMGLAPSADPYMFFLKEDVSWEGEFVAPDGVIMVVCVNGHTVNGSYTNEGSTGGLFYMQCAMHSCKQEDEMMLQVKQVFFDAMLKTFQNYANLNQAEGEEATPIEIEMDMVVALGSDITLSEEWVLSPSSRWTICTNGYTLTGLEYLTAHGASVEIIDCSKLHDCYYFGESSMAVGQQNVDFLLNAGNTPEAWGMPASEDPYTAYLYEDISWEGTLSAPDGVYVALCLNGHTATGKIDNSQTENGGIYLMQCGIHSCPVMGEAAMELSQGFVSLMETIMAKQGASFDVGSGAMVALNGNLTLSDASVWALPSTASITICTNGYTITNLEYMRVNGANVRLMDCSNIGPHSCKDLSGVEAEYLTRANLFEYVDENTGLFTKTGEQTLCLLGNIKLDKTMVIPSGCDVTLCLNGFTLESPKFGRGHDNGLAGNTNYTAIQVLNGASLTICDCSAGQTGAVKLDDDSSNWEDLNGLGASAIQNMGNLTIKGGNLFGIMAVINTGNMVVDGGSVVGLLVGVMQGLEVTEGMVANDTNTFVMNGGEVHSAAIAVAASVGDIVMNGGEVQASFAGVASGLETNNANGEAVIYLNGGTINVGSIDVKAYQKLGFDVKEDTELGMSSDTCVGVMAASELILGGDTLINIEGPGAEEADTTAEILLGDGAVIRKAEGAEIENSYEVSVDDEGATGIVDASIADHVIPCSKTTAKIDESGELTVLPNDGVSVATASVYGYAISLKGEIIMSFYVTATEEFIADPNARVVILYRGVKTAYTLQQAVQKMGDYYVFNLAVSAKDYQKQIRCSFQDSNHVWAGAKVTVNKYLNTIINDTTGTYDKEKNVAIKMQNYCMAASYHFDVAPEYLPSEAMQAELDSITRDTLAEYAAKQTGEAEDITFGGVSIFLQAKTTIRFYFYLKEGKTLEDVTLTVDGKKVEAQKGSSAYYIDIEDITAQNLGRRYTINLDGMVITYCAISYSYSVLNMNTRAMVDDTAVNVAKSLYAYYKAAYSYFNPTEEGV